MDAKYEVVAPDEVAAKQKHLNRKQRRDLAALLKRYPKLFSGQLGHYPHRKMHIELKDDAVPVHMRPYAMPRNLQEVFKKELDHLESLGVLERVGGSEWAAPTFIVPKKDGRVRWVSYFRALNRVIKRKVYPLPRIQDILAKRSGYQFFTELDISMQYYTFELTDEAKDICTIVTPFGKYRYPRVPMGVKQPPDFAQEIMEDILRDVEECDTYIDDIGCFDSSWESPLLTHERVLTRLQDNGFTVNPLKCEWGVKETDWLGYWHPPIGLKPWREKIDAILRLDRPQSTKDVRAFSRRCHLRS